jgi:hypothetical protein
MHHSRLTQWIEDAEARRIMFTHDNEQVVRQRALVGDLPANAVQALRPMLAVIGCDDLLDDRRKDLGGVIRLVRDVCDAHAASIEQRLRAGAPVGLGVPSLTDDEAAFRSRR